MGHRTRPCRAEYFFYPPPVPDHIKLYDPDCDVGSVSELVTDFHEDEDRDGS